MRDWIRRVAALGIVTASVILVGGQCPPPEESPDAGWNSSFSSDGSWMLSVAGQSSDRIYAVGGSPRPTPGEAEVRRWDGDQWSTVDLPDDVPLLTWVHCFSDGRPVMVGTEGTIVWRRGGGWETEELPGAPKLWGVWGPSRDDVWAVGRTSGVDDTDPVAFHYDGSSWTKRTLPDLRHDGVRSLFKVWGTGSDNVYLVGSDGTLVHWNGSQFEDQSPSTTRDLISLWGSGPDNIAVVGGRNSGILLHWDGSNWSTRKLDSLSGTNGVWVPNDSTAWVAGRGGKVARVQLGSESIESEDLETELAFHAIYGLQGAGLFAVGGNLSEHRGPYRGTAWRRSGVE